VAEPTSAPADQAVITIARRNLLTGLVSPFSVFIDGELVGRLRPFATGQYVVTPGRHRVNVRIGKRTMPTKPQVEIEIGAGEVRTFHTRGRRVLFTWGVLTYAPDFEPGSEIKLKQWPPSLQLEMPSAGAVREVRANVLNPSVIRNTRFRQVLKGYNAEEVDTLLRDIASRIELGEKPTSLSKVTFSLTRNGYEALRVELGTVT
jgi:DivIVA domain-containing protein